MSQFFKIYTYTYWDNRETTQLSEVRLLSLNEIFEKFPVIEKDFFDDLLSNVFNQSHYAYYETIKRIIGPHSEDYDIKDWSFIWAFDNQRRMYQFLFQKLKTQKNTSKAVLAALAPPELGKLFAQFKKEAIHKTLSLLNNPSQIKFLIVLAPKGKSLAEEYNFYQMDPGQLAKLKKAKVMGDLPNIQGQWFPDFSPRCPICNELLTPLQDYKVGFGRLICPRCGYKK